MSKRLELLRFIMELKKTPIEILEIFKDIELNRDKQVLIELELKRRQRK